MSLKNAYFSAFLAYNDQYLKKYSSNDRKTYMILGDKFVRHNAAIVSNAICT